MNLQDIKASIPFSALANEPELCRHVQQALTCDGFLPNVVLGDFDDRTINALVQFKRKYHLSGGNNLGQTTAMYLIGVLEKTPSAATAPAGAEATAEKQIISKATATHIFGTEIQPDELADLNACMKLFDITTPQRQRHFLSQIAHESGGLKWLKELASGDDYEGQTELGNTQPGDGRRFKGSGAIQLTGRANYQAFADNIKDQLVMQGCDYVAEKYPFTSAGWFWYKMKINERVDKGANVKDITRIVNGGENELSDRIEYYKKACEVI